MSKEKTMHELVKEFPDKSYRELEKYRDADRQEEAQQIPLTESQQKQEELEPIGEKQRLRKEMGACITAGMKRDKAATELQLMKKVQARSHQLQDELDIVKKENNDLFNRIADALAVNESHQKLNGKLQERLTELEEENKKIHDHLNKRIESARKSGM
jgi:hypothetical protein